MSLLDTLRPPRSNRVTVIQLTGSSSTSVAAARRNLRSGLSCMRLGTRAHTYKRVCVSDTGVASAHYVDRAPAKEDNMAADVVFPPKMTP